MRAVDKRRHVIVTNIPSRHQVELFDEVERLGGIDFIVVYLANNSVGRPWSVGVPNHPHKILSAKREGAAFAIGSDVSKLIKDSSTASVVVCQYSAVTYQQAMAIASHKSIPWALWAEPPGVKYFEVANPVPEVLRPALRRILLSQTRRRATEVWGIGKMAQEKLSSYLKRPVEKLPYASDLSQFARGGSRYTDGGTVRFVFTGRRSYRKGFDVILQALSGLEHRGIPRKAWRLHLFGGSQNQEFPIPESISENIVEEGLVDVGEMGGRLRDFDVMLAPSRHDGWAMVVPEGLSAGLSVLSTTSTGAAVDIGENNRWLRCLPPGDADALADAIVTMIESRGNLVRWGEEAVGAAARYDVRVVAPEFIERCERLADKVYG